MDDKILLCKWGDIARLNEGSFTYIITIQKEPNPYYNNETYFSEEEFIPWISVHISDKTSKIRGLSKAKNHMHIIGNTFNMSIMKRIESVIRWYLELHTPKYICVGAYEIDYDRRIKLYLSRLSKLGYKVKEKVYGEFRHEAIYYLEKIG
jgi:hypothetical protein